MLKPVKDTIKVWETETEPTMQTVIQQLYSLHENIETFIKDKQNTRYGIGFARELKKQIEVRFPETGTKNKLRWFVNFLAPQYKRIHLEAIGKLYMTKEDIKREVNRLYDNVNDELDLNEGFIEDYTEDNPPLSPTSQLRKQMARNRKTFTEDQIDHRLSPIDKWIRRYESFSIAPKDVDILMWWKNHENVLPLLSQIARKILTLPASSAKSERVLSCGWNFVTAKRNRTGSKKV